MKTSELRQKTKEDLQVMLKDKKARMRELRFDLHRKKIKNTKEIGTVRKDIARILTVLNLKS